MTRISKIIALIAVLVTGAVALQRAQVTDPTVEVQLLAINDFHGALEPAAGANGRVGSADAGGIEYLATHLSRMKATNPNTMIVSAGDNIGGTPLLSSLSHDEASIEALNLAGLEVSALGNHELDEGWWELYRIQKGGCHPVDGCQDGTPFAGAAFPYLAANVVLDPRSADPATIARAGVQGAEPRPLLPAYTIREMAGIRIGFIGLILRDAPNMIVPNSSKGLTFGSEVAAANDAARALREQGVRAIVVLLHAGGEPAGGDINGCDGMSANLLDLAQQTSPDVDVIVSGHTHRAYNCKIGNKLVTSAASTGRVVTDIDLHIRRADGEVMDASARNIIVSRDVAKDPRESALLAHYRPVADKVGGWVVGTVAASLLRAPSDAGESALGDVIADGMLEAARSTPGGGAVFAFTNSGGIRADIVRREGEAAAPVTYAELFEVAPFGNVVMVKSLTGEAIVQVLEQQFDVSRILQVSQGLTYAYDTTRPRGDRIDRSSIRISGAPLVPTQSYRVVSTDFLWTRGDGFTGLGLGTDPVIVGVDVDVLADYVSRHSPVKPGPQDRIRKIR